jgi:hypothetical protein
MYARLVSQRKIDDLMYMESLAQGQRDTLRSSFVNLLRHSVGHRDSLVFDVAYERQVFISDLKLELSIFRSPIALGIALLLIS